MHTIYLMAPFFDHPFWRNARVLTCLILSHCAWRIYDRYEYISGIGPRLHGIPRHAWGTFGSANQQLHRASRLVAFVDATGISPIATSVIPRSHRDIPLPDCADHRTYWVGPSGEPLVLIEVYYVPLELLDEISSGSRTALLIPEGIGPYGCGSTSILVAHPVQAQLLQRIAQSISQMDPTKACRPQEQTFVDALLLSKGVRP